MNLNYNKKALAIIILLIVQTASFAQNRNIVDSLKIIVNNKTAKDTTIINAYIDLSSEFQNFNLDTAFYYSDLALKKSLNIDYKKGIADAYKQKGTVAIFLNNYKLADSLLNIALSAYREINCLNGIVKCYNNLSVNAHYKSKNRLALEYSLKALKIEEANNLTENKATILNNIGLYYKNLGDYEKAIEYGIDALKISEELGDKKLIAYCNINIGCLFIAIDEPDKALEYMNKALQLNVELECPEGQSKCLINIGTIYFNQKKYSLALQNHNKSLELNKKYNGQAEMSINYHNIGLVYYKLEKYDTARKYFKKSLAISEQIGNKNGITYLSLSNLETKLKNYKLAEIFCLKSLELFEQTNEHESRQLSFKQLANIYTLTGKYKKAYNTYIKADTIKDSLFNIEKAERIAQIEEKYLNEKNKKQIQALEYETEIKQTEIFHRKKLQTVYLIGFVSAIAAIIIIFIQHRKKNSAYRFLVKKNIDLLNNENELKNIKEQVIVNKSNNNNTTLTDDKKEEILSKLNQLFEIDKIFNDYNLTIDKLAKKISTNRNYLSQIINEEYGKNYSDFINEYRVKETMLMLSCSKKSKQFSIEAIAKEAGFKSVSSFNFAFKKHTGITPSVFKQGINEQSVTSLFYIDGLSNPSI